MVLQNTATMAYSLRRISEPREFVAEPIVISTAFPNKVGHIVIGVEPVCELLQIYAKHFTEFEFDVNWLFQLALTKSLDPEGFDPLQFEPPDFCTSEELSEVQTIQLLCEAASDCITSQLPAGLSYAQLAKTQYMGYRNGRILLVITQDLDNE